MKNLFYFMTMLCSVLCFFSAQAVFYTGGEAKTTFALAIVFLVAAYASSYGYTAWEGKKKLFVKAE